MIPLVVQCDRLSGTTGGVYSSRIKTIAGAVVEIPLVLLLGFGGFILPIVAMIIVGIPLVLLLGFGSFILPIVAMIKVAGGEGYRYPFIFRPL